MKVQYIKGKGGIMQLEEAAMHQEKKALLDDIAYFTHIAMHATYRHECDKCEDYGVEWKQ